MESEAHAILVKQLKRGSEEAFTRLYLLYSGQIYGFALRLTKSAADAEDILQETFIRLWDNSAKLSPDAPFKPYLFKITYHLAIDYFRKQINSVDFQNFIESDYYQLAAEDTAEQQITLEEYRKQIAASVAKLTPRQQEIFRLSREEELSAREIGERLGISEKTVNNQLSLMLATLKTDLLLFCCFMLSNM
ncbi:MAG: RNA polymerase sigma-70 factor [Tannerellaceae bacterium]|jgi:RNA polymerase sigma-70 factor (ECF subfamily)|nr:RNA polymerase sigma-70 factor [Tannerellaceae bacterium]